MNDAVLQVESSLPVDDAVESVRTATPEEGFGVIGYHHLNQTMAGKGVDFARQVRIVEVCNPGLAKKVMTANPHTAAALPCRIAVYENEEGKTLVSTVNPHSLLEPFESEGTCEVAEEVKGVLQRILDKARG